jgi:O-antigen/teichoic acid export membrane protein
MISIAALSAVAVLSARELGPDGRGMLVAQTVITGLMGSLLGTGVGLAARVLLIDSDDPVPLDSYLGLVGVLAAAMAGGSFVAGVTVLPLAGVDMGVGALAAYAGYCVAILAGAMLLHAVAGYGHLHAYALIEAAGLGCGLLVSAVIVGVLDPPKEGFLLALACGYVAQVVLSMALLHRRGYAVGARLDAESWRRLVLLAVPSSVYTVAQAGAFRLDRYVLGLLKDTRAAGIYSVAATAAETVRVGPWAVGQVFLYRFAANRAGVDEARFVRRTTILLTSLAVLGTIAMAGWLVPWAFDEQYRGSVTPLRIVVIGEVAMASYLMDMSRLVARRAVWQAARVSGVGLAAITILDVVLIPGFGPAGAAVASLVGAVAMAVAARRAAVAVDRTS